MEQRSDVTRRSLFHTGMHSVIDGMFIFSLLLLLSHVYTSPRYYIAYYLLSLRICLSDNRYFKDIIRFSYTGFGLYVYSIFSYFFLSYFTYTLIILFPEVHTRSFPLAIESRWKR